jgi:hypothetical protein
MAHYEMSAMQHHELTEHITDAIMAHIDSTHDYNTTGSWWGLFGRDNQGHQNNPVADLHKAVKGNVDHAVNNAHREFNKFVQQPQRGFYRPGR